ncbi:hypothetical protein [Pseudomonas sp. Marseille-QA0892]
MGIKKKIEEKLGSDKSDAPTIDVNKSATRTVADSDAPTTATNKTTGPNATEHADKAINEKERERPPH